MKWCLTICNFANFHLDIWKILQGILRIKSVLLFLLVSINTREINDLQRTSDVTARPPITDSCPRCNCINYFHREQVSALLAGEFGNIVADLYHFANLCVKVASSASDITARPPITDSCPWCNCINYFHWEQVSALLLVNLGTLIYIMN